MSEKTTIENSTNYIHINELNDQTYKGKFKYNFFFFSDMK